MLCFEVQKNDEAPIIAGAADLSVLTTIATYVVARGELDLKVGGMASRSPVDHDHIDWLKEDLKVGDKVTIRLIESDNPSPPIRMEPSDPDLEERMRRQYYEKLKREYEGET